MQQRLGDLGWNVDVDGYLGAQTATAVRAFQRQHHLQPDGRVNARTWRLLCDDTVAHSR